MSDHETNMQQGAVYDIFHWSAVMLGLEAPNEDDEVRNLSIPGPVPAFEITPITVPPAPYDANMSAGIGVLKPDQRSPPFCFTKDTGLFDGPGPLALSAGMHETAVQVHPVLELPLPEHQETHRPALTILEGHEEILGRVGGVTNGYLFQSGCRVIGPSPGRTSLLCATPILSDSKVHKRKAAGSNNALTCDYPGCTSKSTFKRKYELTRHMKAHFEKPIYECPVLGCNRRGGRAFGRFEKLEDHLRQGHTTDALFECLSPDCRMKPTSLHLLYVHIQRHKAKSTSRSSLLDSHPQWVVLCHKLPHWGWGCPIVDCKLHSKFCNSDAIKTHLRADHGESERRVARADLVAYGINPDWNTALEADCCPLCGKNLLRHSRSEHFQDHHGVIDQEHVEAWNNSVLSVAHSSFPASSHWVIRWDRLPYMYFSAGENVFHVCPYCHSQVSIPGSKSYEAHVRGMLKVNQDIERRREVLLRLVPGLWAHPMFDDMEPGSEQTDASGNASDIQ